MAFYVNGSAKRSTATYFDSFGISSLPEEIKKFLRGKNFMVNIFRVQAYDSIMCGYFCIGFLDYMLKGLGSARGLAEQLHDFPKQFSHVDFKKNDKIIENIIFSKT